MSYLITYNLEFSYKNIVRNKHFSKSHEYIIIFMQLFAAYTPKFYIPSCVLVLNDFLILGALHPIRSHQLYLYSTL